MKLVEKIWLLPFTLLVFAFTLPMSYCQSGVVLYPSKGTVFTDIVMEAYVPINSRNNIFWDDKVIALDVRRGQENYPLIMNITCPNEHPYSDLGNHTITVESFYWDGVDKVAYFNTTFEIVECFPCSEYLALNVTYHKLLSNYTELSENYGSLLSNYSDLLNDYNEARALYDSLSSSYNNLEGNYSAINHSYNNLTKSYNALVGELTATRNLSYIFIITTIIFTATTVYFAVRKPKQILGTK